MISGYDYILFSNQSSFDILHDLKSHLNPAWKDLVIVEPIPKAGKLLICEATHVIGRGEITDVKPEESLHNEPP